MTETSQPYILFDLNGQNIAVTEAGIDDTGQLRCTWVCIDKERKFTNEEIEIMLNRAFQDILKREVERDELNKPIDLTGK